MPVLTALGISGAAAAALGGAAVGGIAGAIPKTAKSQSGVNVADASDFEKSLRTAQDSLYNQLSSFTQESGNIQDVSASTQSQRDLAQRLQGLIDQGGLPSQQQLQQGQQFAQQAFAPQQVALQQMMQDQTTASNRQSAMLGRSQDDPILRAKLLQEQTRQQAMLNAQVGAAGQQFAIGIPQQQLQLQAQKADVLGSLSNQAFSNRQSLLNIGNTLSQQERAYRLDTGTKWSTTKEGGGLGGFLSGAVGGLGTAASLGSAAQRAGGFSNLFSGSGQPNVNPYSQALFGSQNSPLLGDQLFQNVKLGK